MYFQIAMGLIAIVLIISFFIEVPFDNYLMAAAVLLLYARFFLWLIKGSRYELQSKIITGVGGIIFIISLFINSPFLQITESMLLIIGPAIGVYGKQNMCISPVPIYVFVSALVLEQAIAHVFNLDFLRYTTITETGKSTQLIGPAMAIPIILGIIAFYRCKGKRKT